MQPNSALHSGIGFLLSLLEHIILSTIYEKELHNVIEIINYYNYLYRAAHMCAQCRYCDIPFLCYVHICEIINK